MDDAAPAESGQDSNSYQLTIPEVVALLRDGEMTVRQLLPWSSNYTFLAEVKQGEMAALVVYKPRRGENPLWDFPTGTLYRRETAAFQVSDALGWHLVPPTVARRGEHGIGMVQLFIHHDPEEHFFTFRDPWPDALTRMALFDVLINNADRKGGHCLRDEDGRIWAIDHGVCFHEEPKLRTVIWEMAGQAIPPDLLADLCRFQETLQANGPAAEALARMLAPVELVALRTRLTDLIEAAHFPIPPPGRRHVPWPMV